MPRIRSIKPQFWLDEKLGEIPRDARLLYIGLWNLADDQGVFEWRSNRIKVQLFPYDSDIGGADIGDWLDLLIKTGDIVKFENGCGTFGYIKSFLEHQEIKNPSKWKFAEIPVGLTTTPALPQQGVSPTPALPLGSRLEGSRLEGSREMESIYIVIFNLWNDLKIISHKKLTADIKRAIDATLKDYSQEEIQQAIRNYAVIVKGAEYYFDHKWTLSDFLSRRKSNNIERFLDLEIAKSNFKKEQGGQGGRVIREPTNRIRPITYLTENEPPGPEGSTPLP